MSRFGPQLSAVGVTFRLWAPAAHAVELILDAPYPMQRDGDWFTLTVPKAGAGTQYGFRIDQDLEIPDPASLFQPHDVPGRSEVIDHSAFAWRASDWVGLPWERSVFLEAHVGTFTAAGTFAAMTQRLDHLAATGVTALELMPLADFPGRWNWGYDGVLLFAPDSTYGRPEELKTLIDAAHMRGLMVFLDVVYNHFGPEGNYLHRLSPAFFTDRHRTPWGAAVDYRVPEVRAFAIENALYWLREYRFDGLRLDAAHAIVEPGEPHILTELADAVRLYANQSHRHIHLVLENDDNAAHFLTPQGGYRAQWNDDYHHSWHALLTGERTGYYRDYQNPGSHIARTLAQGFAYQGEISLHRAGKSRGEHSASLPRVCFVNFLQNHDQIGNRPKGERLTTLAEPEALTAALSVLLLQPGPPLIFMGEEWGTRRPFPFFCDFKDELADAIREGRRREFAAAFALHGDDIPDPLSAFTRDAAVLDWSELASPAARSRLELTQNLLAARRRFIIPLLPAMTGAGDASFSDGVVQAHWRAGTRRLMLIANLSANRARNPVAEWGQPIWGGLPPRELPPWTVYAAIGKE